MVNGITFSQQHGFKILNSCCCFFTPTSNQVTITNFVFKMIISLFLPFQSQDSCWGAQHLLFGISPNSSNFGPPLFNTSFTWPSSEITPALKSFIITISLTAQCPNSYVRSLTRGPQYFLSYFPFPSPKPQASATCNNWLFPTRAPCFAI